MCHSIRVSNFIMLQRVLSRFFVEIFLSHSKEKIRRQPLCAVFQKISGSEKVYG